MKKILLSTALMMTLLITACSAADIEDNSAAQACEENGGKVEIRTENGEQVGYCIFPHGTECSEEEFNNGTCTTPEEDIQLANPASTYCIEQGGTLEIRKDAQGNETGYCVFSDGSECEEWAFYNGECTMNDEETDATPPEDVVYGNQVMVHNSSLLIAESYPIQVELVFEGDLPTPCHELNVIIADPNDENEIKITATSWAGNSEMACTQVITPFEKTITIPTDELEDGTYTIILNGAEAGTFDYPG